MSYDYDYSIPGDYDDHEGQDTVSFPDTVCLGATKKALYCKVPFKKDELGEMRYRDEWIPISQIHDDSEVYADGHTGTLVITAWLADKKGLI